MSMALEIKTKQNLYAWHVGRESVNDWLPILNVEWIEASGDELQKIRAEISGIPQSTLPVVRWFGDDAMFIIANLNY